jgi:tellurite resistance protein
VFGIGFGLAGLATTWRVAVGLGLAPHEVCDALTIVAGSAWLAAVVLFTRYVSTSDGALMRELANPTSGPFLSLSLITPLLLTAVGVAPYARGGATVVIDVLAAATLLMGAWFTSFWMRGGLEPDRLHPGYFLPTVAGGLVGSAAVASVGQLALSKALLGLGLASWIVVGPTIFGRQMTGSPLTVELTPTVAIWLAPASVASVAHLSGTGGHVDDVAAILAGYASLMVLAQVPLLPRLVRLPFTLGTWAFAFSWSAVASTLLFWLGSGHPAGERLLEYIVLAAISLLVGGIAVRTVVAMARGELLPPVPTAGTTSLRTPEQLEDASSPGGQRR